MPEAKVKNYLLIIICIVQTLFAVSKSTFDTHIAELLKSELQNSEKIIVSSNLNQHQQKLVENITDISSIELVNQNNKKIISRINLLVRFRSSDQIEFIKVPADVEAYQKVWLTKRNVSRKEPVKDADIYAETRDILLISGKPFVPGDGRYIYSANITKGSPLTTWKVARDFDITKSDKINARVSAEGVELRIVVTALQSGFIGDRILVKFPSGKKLRGRVIDMNTVRVKI